MRKARKYTFNIPIVNHLLKVQPLLCILCFNSDDYVLACFASTNYAFYVNRYTYYVATDELKQYSSK